MKNQLIVEDSIRNIFKEGSLFFISLIFAYVLAFLSRILLARYFGPSDFGLFNIGLSIIGIISFCSILSIPISLIYYIPKYIQQKKINTINNIINSAILLTMILSISVMITTIYFSNYIAKLYQKPNINIILIYFSFSIPFIAIITTLSAIFQSFKKAFQMAFFKNVLVNVFRVILYLILIFLSYELIYFVLGYSISIIIVGIIFIIYFIRYIKLFFNWNWKFSYNFKKILYFSTPLFISSIIWNIGGNINLLILSFYYLPKITGIYSSILLLIGILFFIAESINVLYFPTFSGLFSRKKKYSLNKIYKIMNKWLIILTLPLVLFFIFFPKSILLLLFGKEYSIGSIILQISAVGAMFQLIGFLSQNSLIAIGKNKISMIISVSCAIIGISSSFLLIPYFSMIGASFALSIQTFFYMILYIYIYYYFTKNHPFTINLIKTLIYYLLFITSLVLSIRLLTININIFYLILLFIIFYISILLIMLFTDEIEKYELTLLKNLLIKIGIPEKIIVKIFSIYKKGII